MSFLSCTLSKYLKLSVEILNLCDVRILHLFQDRSSDSEVLKKSVHGPPALRKHQSLPPLREEDFSADDLWAETYMDSTKNVSGVRATWLYVAIIAGRKK